MNIYDFLLELIKFIFPSIFAVFIFYLTASREDRIKQNDVRRERLEKFFVPFYTVCTRARLRSTDFIYIGSESIDEIVQLLVINLKYIDTDTHSLILDLEGIWGALKLRLSEPVSSYDHKSIKELRNNLEDTFEEIIELIYKQHLSISIKLKMPEPSSELYGHFETK